MSVKGQGWTKFKPRLSVFEQLPTSVYMKAKEMPPLSEVIEHHHDWDQLIYAVSGVLEVRSEEGCYVIPPQQAVWIPANKSHSIGTLNGAQLRSVHMQKQLLGTSDKGICVLEVDELVKALIQRASTFDFKPEMDPENMRLLQVLVDQVALLTKVPLCLPLSDDPLLLPILTWHQQHPDSNRGLSQWSGELAASTKTISRRFDSHLGMTFSHWREQLKLHKAIHWLHDNRSVTEIALELGYDSLPAFIQMFKRNTGKTPGKYLK